MSVTRGAAILLAILPIAASARAEEDKAACRTSFDRAQTLRDDGKLTAARDELLTCSRVCPSAFAKVCDEWLGEVEKALPSIVIRAVDEAGQDLTAVEVTVDERRVKLDGKAIVVDPGSHTIKLSAPERPSVTREIVASQGEKNRVLVITIPRAKTIEAPPPPPPRATSSPPIAAYVVGGLGIAALGGFSYFGLTADARHRELVDGCSKTASCSAADRDAVIRGWRIADAFLVSSIVLVGVGTYLYVTHDRTTVAVTPTASGAGATFTVSF